MRFATHQCAMAYWLIVLKMFSVKQKMKRYSVHVFPLNPSWKPGNLRACSCHLTMLLTLFGVGGFYPHCYESVRACFPGLRLQPAAVET